MSELGVKRAATTLGALAAEINKEHQRCVRAATEAVTHAVTAGELLIAAKEQVGHGGWLAWLQEHFEGSERHAQRYMKLALNREHLDPTRVSDLSLRGALRELTGSVHFSSNSAEWYTPAHIVERAAAALGNIELDPCADAKKSVRALDHYTEEEDGLGRDWRGRVFLNPPYKNIAPWVDKLIAEYEARRVSEAVALVAARTDTAWFEKLGDYPLCFIRGRLKFSGHENSAPFPSAAIYLGENVSGFAKAFGPLGRIYVLLKGAA